MKRTLRKSLSMGSEIERRPRRLPTLLPELPAQAHERITGTLAPEEVDSLRVAYENGARGEVLIGMQSHIRLLTMHLPVQQSEQSAVAQMQRVATQLRKLKCDGWIHSRRIRLRSGDLSTMDALMIEEFITSEDVGGEKRRTQLIISLRSPSQRWHRRGSKCMEDGVSRVLQRIIAEQGAK